MSQESYRLFINICDLYLVLLQVMLFLVVWDIFFRPEKGKNEMLFAGIFAAINVLVRLCPGVPGGGEVCGIGCCCIGVLPYQI